MKTVVGRAAIRIQIPKSVLCNRDGAVSGVVSGGKSRTDTPSPWTSTRRILHHYPLALVSLEPITTSMSRPDRGGDTCGNVSITVKRRGRIFNFLLWLVGTLANKIFGFSETTTRRARYRALGKRDVDRSEKPLAKSFARAIPYSRSFPSEPLFGTRTVIVMNSCGPSSSAQMVTWRLLTLDVPT